MSFAFVIFGGTGDLSKRKLVPSFYELMLLKDIEDFKIISIGRKDITTKEYCRQVLDFYKSLNKKVNKKLWAEFCRKIEYIQADFKDEYEMDNLAERINKLKYKNHIYYLATLPQNYSDIIKMIKKHKLNKEKNYWRRLVLEKPFGYDLKSVVKINKNLSKAFKENQIYRIDHYLAKEAVDNILMFRFTNVLFDKLLNRNYVDHIQISALENIGIEERGGFYDITGALKDMIQSHLLQLLILISMDNPKDYSAERIREEKLKLLNSVERFGRREVKHNVMMAQYKGYHQEKYVDNHSTTETYVALKVFINNFRWRGVPFYIRTGKKLKEKHSLIYIKFKEDIGLSSIEGVKANALVIKIYPTNDIDIYFNTKVPGYLFKATQAKLNFCYSCLFGGGSIQDYSRLLGEVIKGNLIMFSSWPEVKKAWHIIDKIPKYWKKQKLLHYEKGTFGPKEADNLIERDGREWYI